MKYALVFGILAFALAYRAVQSEFWGWQLLFLNGACCFGGVALAYGGVGARVFLKRADGRLPFLSWLLFWPYHALNLSSLWLFLKRQSRLGTLISPITSRVILGPRLGPSAAKNLFSGDFSVLDIAAELSENRVMRGARHYLSLPLLDTCAPTLDDLRRGACWIEARQNEGPVYVHCALGHGRSATFVAAFLMKSGQAPDADGAIALIRSKRPGIGISAAQRQILRGFELQSG